MKIALVSATPDNFHNRAFALAANELGLQCCQLNPLKVKWISEEALQTESEIIPLSTLTAAWIRLGWLTRSEGLKLAAALNAHQIPLINSLESLVKTTDKFLQWSILKKSKYPVPKTYLPFQNFSWDETEFENSKTPSLATFLEDSPNVFIKSRFGSQGFGVLPVSTRTWKPIQDFARNERAEVLVQERIVGKEVRVLLLQDRVLAAIEKTSDNLEAASDARANLSQGFTSARPTKISTGELELVQNARQILGLSFTGIDFFRTENGPIILECNAFPGVEKTHAVAPFDLQGELKLFLQSQILGRQPDV